MYKDYLAYLEAVVALKYNIYNDQMYKSEYEYVSVSKHKSFLTSKKKSDIFLKCE